MFSRRKLYKIFYKYCSFLSKKWQAGQENDVNRTGPAIGRIIKWLLCITDNDDLERFTIMKIKMRDIINI